MLRSKADSDYAGWHRGDGNVARCVVSRPLAVLAYCTVGWAVLSGDRVRAAHPIQSYELDVLPELSTLTLTGGIAGVHQVYRVDGTMTLSFDAHPHPPDTNHAEFEAVQATLDRGGMLDGADLDTLLRLTGWQGFLVGDGRLAFTGTVSGDREFTAAADLNSSRMHLRGNTDPICCDFFDYSWDIFALNRFPEHGHAHADFNEDGSVDGDDLLDALLNFGMSEGADHAHGDADGEGDVDRTDIHIWRATSGFHSAATAIPEPGGLVLVLVTAAVASWIWTPPSNQRSRTVHQ